MKSSLLFSPALAAILTAAALFAAPVAHAQTTFEVQLNTSGLIGHPAGPFYLDFQLNDGTGLGNGNNKAIINDFNFSTGSPLGSATSFGGVTGSLASSITLTDSSPFNEFFQAFTPGATLRFRLTLTNVFNAPAPDLFSFAILDSDLFNIPTLAPGTDALISFNLTGGNGAPVASTYATSSVFGPVAGGPPIALAAPSVGAVPEPSTYGLMGAVALLGAIAWKRRQRSR